MPEVYVLVLNWNGWKDTIECLESLFRLDYPNYKVIVCDNGSEDGSMEQIKAWADGNVDLIVQEDDPMHAYTFPPVPKPIRYVEYNREQAQVGGDLSEAGCPLILIQTGENLGFAGGNNVGLRYALARGDFDFVWLLNNDTVARADALSQLVTRSEQGSEVGICGSKLLYYHQPEKVEALGGGMYYPWLGMPRHIGAGEDASQVVQPKHIERKMTYVIGASMLVRKSFLLDVGLMNEDYFLYFEDLDWALRARGRYSLAYAPKSIVYHKEGSATGGDNRNPDARSRNADYYQIRNRVRVTKKFYPWALPGVYLGLTVTLLNRMRRRQWDRVGMILKLWRSGFEGQVY